MALLLQDHKIVLQGSAPVAGGGCCRSTHGFHRHSQWIQRKGLQVMVLVCPKKEGESLGNNVAARVKSTYNNGQR
ncbi:hypothetical protein MIDIC_100006 [Alphaproteobacteria bacterium]